MRLLDTEELLRIQSIKGDAGTREPAGRSITNGEVSALLEACAKDASPADARDAAMIALAAATSARQAEIASIIIENLLPSSEEEHYTIRLVGKRNRGRMFYLTGNTARTRTRLL